MHIRLFLGCVHATGGERNSDSMARSVGRFFNRSNTTKNDGIGQRNLRPASCVKRNLYGFDLAQCRCQSIRLVCGPILLWCQTHARTVGTATLV